MLLYDTIIDDIKVIQKKHAAEGQLRELVFSDNLSWPSANGRNLLLQSDTAIELGNPADEGVALSLWTQMPGKVVDNRITLVGPDISKSAASRLPFGKIVLLEGNGFDEENAYDRYREIDLVRFDISLKGYMMRAASQYKREWSRISKEAVKNGFSFSIFGNALIAEFKKLDYINSVEVFFITSNDKDVSLLKPMAEQVNKINMAMSKMMEEMSDDCSECEYEEVCDEVAALRNMRKNKENGSRSHA
jgi:CO dehydrogenase/acetyl-CoA synthase beta subunit